MRWPAKKEQPQPYIFPRMFPSCHPLDARFRGHDGREIVLRLHIRILLMLDLKTVLAVPLLSSGMERDVEWRRFRVLT
jgi:hypothetical protein